MPNEIREYLGEVKKGLERTLRDDHRTYYDFKREVLAYIGSHPGASLDEIYDVFGTPEEIVENNIIKATPELLRKVIQPRRKIFIIVAVCLSIVALCGIVYLTLYAITNF